ncbi:MAG: 30S ribosomal protein S16 [Oligoflexia bacterium]|nr:30S ribosomal protein S16 [Oligoflexia bacterium]
MAVVIRLSRAGKTNTPLYRVTVADQRRWRDGKFLARVGWYNPCRDEMKTRMKLDLTAIDEWIKKGARPSETVAKLIRDFRSSQAQ